MHKVNSYNDIFYHFASLFSVKFRKIYNASFFNPRMSLTTIAKSFCIKLYTHFYMMTYMLQACTRLEYIKQIECMDIRTFHHFQ